MERIEERPGKVSFKQAWKDYFMGYVDFKGRSTRGGFWWVALILIILSIAAFFTILILFLNMMFSAFQSISQLNTDSMVTAIGNMQIPIIVMLLVVLALFLPTLALLVRRLRDAGMRGRGQLVMFGFLIVTNLIIYIFIIYTIIKNGDTAGNLQDFNTSLDTSTLYSQQTLINPLLMMFINLYRMIIHIGLLVLTVLPTGTMATSKESGVKAFFFKNKRFYQEEVKEKEVTNL